MFTEIFAWDSREIRGLTAGMYAWYHLVRPYALFLFPIQMHFFYSFQDVCVSKQCCGDWTSTKADVVNYLHTSYFLFQAERPNNRRSKRARKGARLGWANNAEKVGGVGRKGIARNHPSPPNNPSTRSLFFAFVRSFGFLAYFFGNTCDQGIGCNAS